MFNTPILEVERGVFGFDEVSEVEDFVAVEVAGGSDGSSC